MKHNCIRSCLIEHQSFLDSKINIDPTQTPRLDVSSKHYVVSRETWYREVKIFWVSVTFLSWINK